MQSATPQDGTPVKFKGMIKPLVIVILAVAIVLGGIFGWQAFIASMIKKNMMAGASAPVTVSAITATATKWQAQMQAVGTLRAVRGADLSAQASGVVDDIEFDSGNEVAAGKVLLRLKPNDDFAKLQQLEAAANSRRKPTSAIKSNSLRRRSVRRPSTPMSRRSSPPAPKWRRSRR